MNSLQIAKQFDKDDNPQRASLSYESALSQGDGGMEEYLDLAVLYFVCNDGGYAAHHKLSASFLTHAWSRLFEVLDEAEVVFGRHPEIEFWRRYCTFILLGDQWMDADTCLKLTESGESRVPFFYLFGSFAGLADDEAMKYYSQAFALYESVRDGTTARKRYIRSVLDSAFQS